MKDILENSCQLLHQRKYKEAEELLIKFIEKTLTKSSDSSGLNNLKEMYITIYCLFNQHYLNWLRRNKIDIKKERQLFKSNNQSNYLIAVSSKAPEMEDLLYELGNYLNNSSSKEQRQEVLYHLKCYKNGSRKLNGARTNHSLL